MIIPFIVHHVPIFLGFPYSLPFNTVPYSRHILQDVFFVGIDLRSLCYFPMLFPEVPGFQNQSQSPIAGWFSSGNIPWRWMIWSYLYLTGNLCKWTPYFFVHSSASKSAPSTQRRNVAYWFIPLSRLVQPLWVAVHLPYWYLLIRWLSHRWYNIADGP